MRICIPIMFIYLIPISLKAQTGQVTYDAIINRSQDGTPKEDMFNDDLYAKGRLYFDGKTSLYRQLLPDSSITIRAGGGTMGYQRNKFPVTATDTLGTIYRMNFSNGSIKARMSSYNMKAFNVVTDSIKTIHWNIAAIKKNIGKFRVTKAEATYLGRKWIAWFAPDIPVSMGPWKLYGLPGLILEAEDVNRKFRFIVKDIQIPFPKASAMINPKVLNEKAINKQEFITLEKRKKDDQYRFTKANMEAAAGPDAGPVSINIKFPETIEIYK